MSNDPAHGQHWASADRRDSASDQGNSDGVQDSFEHEIPRLESPTRPSGYARLVSFLAFAAVAGLALYVRTIQWDESLWLDELHTAWVVADGPGTICERAAIGNQSPLWFFLVWATTQAFGFSEIALRLPSVVAGVGLVVLAFYVTRCWTGQRTAGLFVALLVALDRNCIFYAQEARPYAWVQLVGLAQVFVFYRLVDRPSRFHRVAFVALTVLLFYLHYTSVLLLAAEVVYYVVLHTRRSWRPCYRWPQILLDLSLALLCMLPASWHVMEIAARRENWAMFVRKGPVQDVWYLFPLYAYVQLPVIIVGVAYLVRWLSGWLGARPTHSESSRASVTVDTGNAVKPPVAGVARLQGTQEDARILTNPATKGAMIVVVRSANETYRSRSDQRHTSKPTVKLPAFLSVCWLFIPLLLAWSLTYFELARVFFLRYLIVCALAPILFCGLVFAVCPSRLFRVACVVVVIWLSVSRSGIVEQTQHDGRVIGDRNQDWRSAVAAISEHSHDPTTPVFVRSGLIEATGLRSSDDPQLREYCLLPVRGIYRLQQPDESLIPLPIHHSGRLTPDDCQRIQNAGGGWFLLAGLPSTVSSIESELLSNWNTPRNQPRVAERQAYGYVTVLRLAIDPKSTNTQRTDYPSKGRDR